MGGSRRKGEEFLQPPRPADRIYLRSILDRASNDLFIETTIHELAHFVSPLSPAIEDHGYGWINDLRMTGLTAHQRVRNAQNYATYAIESKFGQRQGRLPI